MTPDQTPEFDRDFGAGTMLDSIVLGETLEQAGVGEFNGDFDGEFDGGAGRVRAEWYRSELGVEFVSWRSQEGRLLQIQLNVRGEIAQWSSARGAQTGLVVEQDSAIGGREETVRYDAQPVRTTLSRAAEIVSAAVALTAEERRDFGALFS